MTEEHIFTVTITIGSALVGVIGTILGIWIGPYVSRSLERRKEKDSIKPNLIKITYTFYSIRKMRFELANSNGFRARMLNNMLIDLTTNIHSDTTNLQSLYNSTLDHHHREEDLQTKYLDRLIEIEAELHKSMIDVKRHFGNRTYKHVYSVIKPAIDNSNKDVLLHEYRDIPLDEHKKIETTLTREIQNGLSQINKDLQQVILAIENILP